MTLVKTEDITGFIPQRAPFVMVDSLVSRENSIARSNFQIKDDNILVEDGIFSVSGLLENIAQTAAANVGYECSLNNIPVPIGFIGAISKVKVFDQVHVNTKIETSIEIKHEIFNITLIQGEVKQNGKTIISCEMKIMVEKTE